MVNSSVFFITDATIYIYIVDDTKNNYAIMNSMPIFSYFLIPYPILGDYCTPSW
jgi:hypothetical protein